MIVRALDPCEWEKYRALRLKALESAPDAFCSTFDSARCKPEGEWQERLEPDRQPKMFFAEVNGELVAMVGADGSVGNGCGELTAMFVEDSARGAGVGRALVDHAVEYFRSLGLKTARLDVRPGQLGAITFYQKLGFAEVGVDSDGNLRFERELGAPN